SAQAAIDEQLAPDLSAAAELVGELADVEHDALIGQHLAAYLAGRDATIDLGRSLDIVSQPDRITFDDLVAATPDARVQFDNDVMTPLSALAGVLDALDHRVRGISLPNDRWTREVRDGFAIDADRAHFVIDVYRATLEHLAGDDAAAAAARSDAQHW